MIDSKYSRGTTTLVHDNGQGCHVLLHANDRATLNDVMATGYFDLANRNRGKHPFITEGDLIDVNAFDGYARLRVMSMDDQHQSIETLAVTAPVMFDEQPKAEVKRGPGRPTKAELAARAAQAN